MNSFIYVFRLLFSDIFLFVFMVLVASVKLKVKGGTKELQPDHPSSSSSRPWKSTSWSPSPRTGTSWGSRRPSPWPSTRWKGNGFPSISDLSPFFRFSKWCLVLCMSVWVWSSPIVSVLDDGNWDFSRALYNPRLLPSLLRLPFTKVLLGRKYSVYVGKVRTRNFHKGTLLT